MPTVGTRKRRINHSRARIGGTNVGENKENRCGGHFQEFHLTENWIIGQK